MQKGERHTMFAEQVQQATGMTSQNKYIHIIHFSNPNQTTYIAEEISDHSTSQFKPKTRVQFEVTNPGVGSKRDWIRFLQEVAGADAPKLLSRDNLDVAKVGFTCAVQLGIKNDWPESEIMEKAITYAIKIKSIAEIL